MQYYYYHKIYKREKEQKLVILNNIIQIFLIRRRAYSDPYFGSLEYMQYIDYGLQLEPNETEYLIRKGFDNGSLQNDKTLLSQFIFVRNPSSKARELRNRQDEKLKISPRQGGYSHCKYEDYSYIDFHRRAFESFESNRLHPINKKYFYSELVYYEAHREYHCGSIKEFKALSQVGTPDHELQEAKWELFKITMSDITRNSVSGRLQCECMIFAVGKDKQVFYVG